MENTRRFQKNDDGFVCSHCGRQVHSLGYTSRDHCPYCLYSLHVDIFPGDRANDCCGLLEPIGLDTNKKGYQIVYKCQTCGKIVKNITAQDDNKKEIIRISTLVW